MDLASVLEAGRGDETHEAFVAAAVDERCRGLGEGTSDGWRGRGSESVVDIVGRIDGRHVHFAASAYMGDVPREEAQLRYRRAIDGAEDASDELDG